MKGLKLGKQTEERAIIHNSAELTQKKNQEEIQTLKTITHINDHREMFITVH